MTTDTTTAASDQVQLDTGIDDARQAFLSETLNPSVEALADLCRANNIALFVAIGVPSPDGLSGGVGTIAVPLSNQTMPAPIMRAMAAMNDDPAPDMAELPG